MYVYIYIYICIHIHTHAYKCTYTCTCIRLCYVMISKHTRADMLTCVGLYMHADVSQT